jgi:hypothetical protein
VLTLLEPMTVEDDKVVLPGRTPGVKRTAPISATAIRAATAPDTITLLFVDIWFT